MTAWPHTLVKGRKHLRGDATSCSSDGRANNLNRKLTFYLSEEYVRLSLAVIEKIGFM